MRTRTRNTIGYSNQSVTRTVTATPPNSVGYVHGTSGTQAGTSHDFSNDFAGYGSKVGVVETITDEPHGLGAYNEVTHTRESWMCDIRATTNRGESTENGSAATAVSVILASCGASQLDYALASAPVLPDLDNTEALAISSLNTGVRRLPTNIPQFLGELRELKDTLGSIRKRFSGADSVEPASFRRFFDGKSSILDFVRSAVKGDLFYKFAVRPLVSDLRNLAGSVDRVKREYDRILSKRPQVATYTIRASGTASDSFTNPYVYKNAWSFETKSERTVTAWASYRYGSLPVEPSLFEVGLVGAGFYDLHKAAWELIPFSFVVDYFANIGQWLNQFNGDSIALPVEELRLGVSRKVITSAEVSTYFDSGNDRYKWSAVSSDGPVKGYVRKTQYSREIVPASLPQFNLPVLTLPDYRQAFTLLELAFLNFSRSS